MRITNNLSNWFMAQLETMPLEMLRNLSPTAENWLSQMMGSNEAQEVRALLTATSERDESLCTVLIPGLMGSLLTSVRGLSTLLWFNISIVTAGKINLLDLNEDGTDDRSPQIDIVPIGIEKTNYLKTILTLANQTQLFEFPYDWRKRLQHTAARLNDSLLRWSAAVPNKRFVLIGHSMGGVLARTFATLYPETLEHLVDKIILIGSPLYGAPAVVGAFTGNNPAVHALERLHPDNDVQQFAFSAPSIYQLLPPPPELWPSEVGYPVNWDLYDAAAWHIPGLRQDYLDEAKASHQQLLRADPQIEMWQIAGHNQPTIVRFQQDRPVAGPPSYTPIRYEQGPESGDDTVPLWSVQHPDINNLYAECVHNLLPTDNKVLEDVMAIIRGDRPQLPDQVPAPTGLLEQIVGSDLGQQVEELVAKLEAGSLSREDITRFFFPR